jgi:tryptophan 2,3-dioxygenase
MENPNPESRAPREQRILAWRDLALELPRHHDGLSSGRGAPFTGCLASLPPLGAADLADLPLAEARLIALDVLMIEAFLRRHALSLDAGVTHRLATATTAVAERLDTVPILTYPLYIRANPTDVTAIRRFTPTEAEYRFIRMHRLIEDRFDEVIDRLSGVLDADEPRAALAGAVDDLAAGFRVANHTMAGFRGQERMPREVFLEEFRPYYEPSVDPETGAVVYEGPSGLQSPTYRVIVMMAGMRDRVLDDWTRRIARYHEPHWRDALARWAAVRDAGGSLSALADSILGPGPDLPHLHPEYGAHIPVLLDLAARRGYLTPDAVEALKAHDVELGRWLDRVPSPSPLPETGMPDVRLSDRDRADLRRLAELEAMLFGLHVEHVATTAVHIGHVKGTGGTSGVEFLLLATFRRAFPRLWHSGVGARLVGGIADLP